MSSQMLKLITLLSSFICLSGIAMESPKYSMDEILIEIKVDMHLYSDIYNSDLAELRTSIKSENFINSLSILKQMNDNIQHYTQKDKNSFLSLAQAYEQELYQNELIGLYQFGTLAQYKDTLCLIKVQCMQALNPMDIIAVQDTAQSEVTKKLHISSEPLAIEKNQNLKALKKAFKKDIKKKINTIAYARILGDLKQKKILEVSDELLNHADKKWSKEFFKALDDAIERGSKELVTDLWQANFNDNHAHFKSREEELYKLSLEQLKENDVAKSKIKFFKGCIAPLVYKKETQRPLKSQKDKPYVAPIPKTTPVKKNKPNLLAQKVNAVLNRVLRTTEYNDIEVILYELPDILTAEDALTVNKNDIINLKFRIDETIRRVYQNCILGDYGNSEQKLQLQIFDVCADKLIELGTQLRIKLQESDSEIQTYIDNINKFKESCLYEIKVIRDTEKIADADDVNQWTTIIQERFTHDIERQNAASIEKTIKANFDAHKTPILAENYEIIIDNVKNMFNDGKDTANSTWINNHERIFNKTATLPNDIPHQQSIFQTCKDHWVLSSLALAAVATGIYYAWEYWNEDDETEDTNKPAQTEASAKETDKKQASEKPQTKDRN